jgi:flagella basal body P-ring formation protein FlgA
MIELANIALASCLAVGANSDAITVRDLAPAFQSLDARILDKAVGLAPAPGVQRVIYVSELRRIAARMGITEEPQRELCFARPVAPLAAGDLLTAMRGQLPQAEIEIIDYSRMPAPMGQLEFPLNQLRQTGSVTIWRGFVRYGGGLRFPIWAQVRATVVAPRIVAETNLKAGLPIDSSQLRLEMREEAVTGIEYVNSIEDAAGRILERSVPAGTVLRAQWLIVPRDVMRGDKVQVDVWSGSTHLRLDAVAEAPGAKGQTIPVRNPETKKRFWVQVAGKGRVSVGKEGS